MPVHDQFQAFCYQVEQLRREPLVESGWNNSLNLNWNQSRGTLESTLTGPEEVKFRSLLLCLRRFVSADEPVFLNRIYNLCEQHVTNEEMKLHLRDARAAWKQAQKTTGMTLTHNGRELTPEHLADLWINGHYFHNDAAKARELNELAGVGIHVPRMSFNVFIGETIRQVLYVDAVLRHALRDGCVS